MEYQNECNNYILRSINHEMHLQEIKKSTLSIFDEKRCYLNKTESTPWNQFLYDYPYQMSGLFSYTTTIVIIFNL